MSRPVRHFLFKCFMSTKPLSTLPLTCKDFDELQTFIFLFQRNKWSHKYFHVGFIVVLCCDYFYILYQRKTTIQEQYCHSFGAL